MTDTSARLAAALTKHWLWDRCIGLPHDRIGDGAAWYTLREARGAAAWCARECPEDGAIRCEWVRIPYAEIRITLDCSAAFGVLAVLLGELSGAPHCGPGFQRLGPNEQYLWWVSASGRQYHADTPGEAVALALIELLGEGGAPND